MRPWFASCRLVVCHVSASLGMKHAELWETFGPAVCGVRRPAHSWGGCQGSHGWNTKETRIRISSLSFSVFRQCFSRGLEPASFAMKMAHVAGHVVQGGFCGASVVGSG